MWKSKILIEDKVIKLNFHLNSHSSAGVSSHILITKKNYLVSSFMKIVQVEHWPETS